MGRVEVQHSKRWGTVCDRDFTYTSANVLCRSLGYGTARSVTRKAGYGRGIGKVWIGQLNCSGAESWLHKCPNFSWRQSPGCTRHTTDVGVECHVPNPYEELVSTCTMSRGYYLKLCMYHMVGKFGGKKVWQMDFIHYSFTPLILFRVPYTLGTWI